MSIDCTGASEEKRILQNEVLELQKQVSNLQNQMAALKIHHKNKIKESQKEFNQKAGNGEETLLFPLRPGPTTSPTGNSE